MDIASVLLQSDPAEFRLALSDLLDARVQRVGYAGLTDAEQTVRLVDELEEEVTNGGIPQFFVNSAGDRALDTVAALRDVGASQTADVLARATAMFPNGRPSPNRQERCDELDALPEDRLRLLSDLDDEFLENDDDLNQLVRAFVEAHRGEFGSG